MAAAHKDPTRSRAPPPFSSDEELFALRDPPSNINNKKPKQHSWLTLPAVYHPDKERGFVEIDPQNKPEFADWMQFDLDVSRLNKVEKYLWLVGPDSPAKPLHGQIAAGRSIVVTERAHMHLVWHSSTVWIKPLPEYLLCGEIWTSHICNKAELYGSALGFFWSYIWLVRNKSDFQIAHGISLLPSEMSWEQWTTLCRAVMKNIEHDRINVRYLHGEMRLEILNWIYRLCPETREPATFFRGYLYGYHSKSTFLRENTTWLVSALVYIAIVLEAMQVGLATTVLGAEREFQRISFGFTMFAILAPQAIFLMVVLMNLVIFIFNMAYTLGRRKRDNKNQRNTSELQ